jgi:putative flippase GtrA
MVNTLIGLMAIYALMFIFGADAAFANVIGYAVGLVTSFTLNRMWTFNSTQPVSHVLPKYALTAILCYFLNLGVVLMSTIYFSANPYLAQLLGVFIYTVCMFVGCRLFVFMPPQRTTIIRPS